MASNELNAGTLKRWLQNTKNRGTLEKLILLDCTSEYEEVCGTIETHSNVLWFNRGNNAISHYNQLLHSLCQGNTAVVDKLGSFLQRNYRQLTSWGGEALAELVQYRLDQLRSYYNHSLAESISSVFRLFLLKHTCLPARGNTEQAVFHVHAFGSHWSDADMRVNARHNYRKEVLLVNEEREWSVLYLERGVSTQLGEWKKTLAIPDPLELRKRYRTLAKELTDKLKNCAFPSEPKMHMPKVPLPPPPIPHPQDPLYAHPPIPPHHPHYHPHYHPHGHYPMRYRGRGGAEALRVLAAVLFAGVGVFTFGFSGCGTEKLPEELKKYEKAKVEYVSPEPVEPPYCRTDD